MSGAAAGALWKRSVRPAPREPLLTGQPGPQPNLQDTADLRVLRAVAEEFAALPAGEAVASFAATRAGQLLLPSMLSPTSGPSARARSGWRSSGVCSTTHMID